MFLSISPYARILLVTVSVSNLVAGSSVALVQSAHHAGASSQRSFFSAPVSWWQGLSVQKKCLVAGTAVVGGSILGYGIYTIVKKRNPLKDFLLNRRGIDAGSSGSSQNFSTIAPLRVIDMLKADLQFELAKDVGSLFDMIDKLDSNEMSLLLTQLNTEVSEGDTKERIKQSLKRIIPRAIGFSEGLVQKLESIADLCDTSFHEICLEKYEHELIRAGLQDVTGDDSSDTDTDSNGSSDSGDARSSYDATNSDSAGTSSSQVTSASQEISDEENSGAFLNSSDEAEPSSQHAGPATVSTAADVEEQGDLNQLQNINDANVLSDSGDASASDDGEGSDTAEVSSYQEGSSAQETSDGENSQAFFQLSDDAELSAQDASPIATSTSTVVEEQDESNHSQSSGAVYSDDAVSAEFELSEGSEPSSGVDEQAVGLDERFKNDELSVSTPNVPFDSEDLSFAFQEVPISSNDHAQAASSSDAHPASEQERLAAFFSYLKAQLNGGNEPTGIPGGADEIEARRMFVLRALEHANLSLDAGFELEKLPDLDFELNYDTIRNLLLYLDAAHVNINAPDDAVVNLYLALWGYFKTEEVTALVSESRDAVKAKIQHILTGLLVSKGNIGEQALKAIWKHRRAINLDESDILRILNETKSKANQTRHLLLSNLLDTVIGIGS